MRMVPSVRSRCVVYCEQPGSTAGSPPLSTPFVTELSEPTLPTALEPGPYREAVSFVPSKDDVRWAFASARRDFWAEVASAIHRSNPAGDVGLSPAGFGPAAEADERCAPDDAPALLGEVRRERGQGDG